MVLQRQSRRTLSSPVVMVGAALVMRLAVMVWLYNGPAWVTLEKFAFPSEMARVAHSIASGSGFSSPLPAPTGPTAWVSPVYAYLLAGVFRAFGIYSFKSSVATLTLNCLFSALTCLPILYLTRKAFGPRVATAAGWSWVLFPNALFIPVNWVWETCLATLLLTVLVCLALHIEQSPTLGGWVGFGALWGLAALTSPALLSVLPFLGGWLCLRLRRRVRWIGPASAAGIVFVLCVFPWFLRNFRTFGHFVPFRSGFWLELRVGNSPETGVRWRGWLHPSESLAEQHKYQVMGEIAYMAAKRKEALDFIGTHPGTFAWLTIKRISYIWTGIWSLAPRDLLAEPLDALNIPISTALSVLAFVGLRMAFRRGILIAWPCALVLFSVPLVYYVTHINIRYRHPMDPFLILLAAYAVVESSTRARELQRAGAPKRVGTRDNDDRSTTATQGQ